MANVNSDDDPELVEGDTHPTNNRLDSLTTYSLEIDANYARRIARATVAFTILTRATQFALIFVAFLLIILFIVLALVGAFLPVWESVALLIIVLFSAYLQLSRAYLSVVKQERSRIPIGDTLQSAFDSRAFALKTSRLKLKTRYLDIRKLTVLWGVVFLQTDARGYLLGLPLEVFPPDRVRWVRARIQVLRR